jgi:hypothetical protein
MHYFVASENASNFQVSLKPRTSEVFDRMMAISNIGYSSGHEEITSKNPKSPRIVLFKYFEGCVQQESCLKIPMA